MLYLLFHQQIYCIFVNKPTSAVGNNLYMYLNALFLLLSRCKLDEWHNLDVVSSIIEMESYGEKNWISYMVLWEKTINFAKHTFAESP